MALKKILIVEDQIGVSQFLKQGLEEESFEVTVAQNGIDGLKFLMAQSFGLVLLDWELPGMSGIEVCQKFRLKDTSTPVIFLTANDTLEDTLKGLRSGANDYIKKTLRHARHSVRHQKQPKQRCKSYLTNPKENLKRRVNPILQIPFSACRGLV